MAISYRANPVTRLHWVDWGDEFVVFEVTSGQTHRIDALRAYALNAMADSPLDAETLQLELAGVADLAGHGLREALDAALIEFDRLGLIEAVDE